MVRRQRKATPKTIQVAPEFFRRLTAIRKEQIKKTRKQITQIEVTRMLSKSKIKLPDPFKKNGKKKTI